LFDITQTGVLNRSKPTGDDIDSWIARRNTQCNFDTILQVISLRSQPEVCKIPTMAEMTEKDFDNFGFLYKSTNSSLYWHFDFEVQHPSVFENGIIPLGALYKDCEGVPMIVCDNQIQTPAFLDVTEELRNIYFEVL
jgi:hypothetical protein